MISLSSPLALGQGFETGSLVMEDNLTGSLFCCFNENTVLN